MGVSCPNCKKILKPERVRGEVVKIPNDCYIVRGLGYCEECHIIMVNRMKLEPHGKAFFWEDQMWKPMGVTFCECRHCRLSLMPAWLRWLNIVGNTLFPWWIK